MFQLLNIPPTLWLFCGRLKLLNISYKKQKYTYKLMYRTLIQD